MVVGARGVRGGGERDPLLRKSQAWLAFFSLSIFIFHFFFNSRILWRENEGIHQARGRKGGKGTGRCLLSNLLKSRMALLLMALFISGNGFGVSGGSGIWGNLGGRGRSWTLPCLFLSFPSYVWE